MKNDIDALFNNYADAESFKKELDSLKIDINDNEYSIAEIRKKIFDVCPAFPSNISKIEKEAFNNIKIYRVRKFKKIEIRNLNLIRTFSYPDPAYCVVNGRANLKERSVFYCSDSAITALLESKPVENDYCYVSIWEPHFDRDVVSASYISNLHQSNSWYEEIKSYNEFLNDEWQKIKEKKTRDILKHLNTFICECFVNENQPYPITACMANHELYELNGIDLLMYASIITNSHHCNMAIHPNIIDNYFRLKKVFVIKAGPKSEKTFDFKFGVIGININTNISWHIPNTEEIDEINKLLGGMIQP